jgi:hypothetical protein
MVMGHPGGYLVEPVSLARLQVILLRPQIQLVAHLQAAQSGFPLSCLLRWMGGQQA